MFVQLQINFDFDFDLNKFNSIKLYCKISRKKQNFANFTKLLNFIKIFDKIIK